eukprot:TRINITY_DN5364_c0_g1_i1.p1 TRINITY_DN5364_c0_g1~~TRINITY_DN5364_c0_g1_i1.p1  ORF type:complete len:316 (-),score=35.75 TRINITY_DN5364_c0_g1_i1:47-994(-)
MALSLGTLLLTTLLIASAALANDSCKLHYESSDSHKYDLSAFAFVSGEAWKDVTDSEDRTWSFNLCPMQPATLYDRQPEGSSVYVTDSEGRLNRGTTESIIYSDSPLGPDMGVEITLGVQGDDGNTYKTIIEFVCDEQLRTPVYSLFLNGERDATMFVNSSLACPRIEGRPDGSPMDDPVYPADGAVNPIDGYDYEPHFGSITFPGPMTMWMLVAGVIALFTCCLCCSRARKMRQHRRAREAIEMTYANPALMAQNVEYRPPSEYQPPNYYYYYPSQPAAPFASEPFAPAAPSWQEQSDEQMAIDLQARYDQEHA